MESAIEEYPVRKAKTVRFTCGAPRSPKLIGDGSRMLFLRSAGEQDTENSLWLAICGEDAYAEVELVNAGELVNVRGRAPPGSLRTRWTVWAIMSPSP